MVSGYKIWSDIGMTMKHAKVKFVFLLAIISCQSIVASSQQGEYAIQNLVEDSERRLAVGHQVALAKWDSRSSVEDPVREIQVLQNAVKEGKSKGLDDSLITNFFRAQIEANKVVQYSLLAEWRRTGRAPKHLPLDLQSTIRPELDEIQTSLIRDLIQTSKVRSNPECPVIVAKAIGQYLARQHKSRTDLNAIALDRSMAAACAN